MSAFITFINNFYRYAAVFLAVLIGFHLLRGFGVFNFSWWWLGVPDGLDHRLYWMLDLSGSSLRS
jgi:hypothetical protein